MKRSKEALTVFMAILPILVLASTVTAASEAPKIVHAAMMMEHVNMGCANCHGDNGPAGVDMKNHPGQMCTDCHEEGTLKIRVVRKPKVAKGEAPPLGPMMMEHVSMGCANCHGDNGPAGVDMKNHPGQQCNECHKTIK